MYSIPVPLPNILYLLAGLSGAALVIMWLWRITPAQAGWRWGGWRTPAQALGWGGLLAVIAAAWWRILLEQKSYLPIPLQPAPTDLLVLLLLAPVAEEMLFRGAIFAGLRRGWRLGWALLLSALIAAACSPLHLVLAFTVLAGFGYALAFQLSRSLAAAIGAHMLVALALLVLRMHPRIPLHFSWQQYGFAVITALLLISATAAWKGEPQA